MSTLPPAIADSTPRAARSFSTYFAWRIVIALLLTGLDAIVILKSVLAGLRDSVGMPILHNILIIAVVGIALTLAHVWYKTLRYRQPSKSNSRYPLL